MNSKDGVNFTLLFTLWSSLSARTQHDGKAGGLQILRCQGIAVGNYSFTPDAPALRDEASNYILGRAPLDSEALRLLQRWG